MQKTKGLTLKRCGEKTAPKDPKVMIFLSGMWGLRYQTAWFTLNIKNWMSKKNPARCKQYLLPRHSRILALVGGLEHVFFSPIVGMMIQSDFYIFQSGWLIVWNCLFSIIYGMPSFPLINLFQRGRAQPPTLACPKRTAATAPRSSVALRSTTSPWFSNRALFAFRFSDYEWDPCVKRRPTVYPLTDPWCCYIW